MIKSFAAFAIFAVLGASVIALPWFAPKAEASENVTLAKADRLAVRSLSSACLNQVWPNYSTECLRSKGSKVTIVEAYLTTARR
jgi:hypothetical protein